MLDAPCVTPPFSIVFSLLTPQAAAQFPRTSYFGFRIFIMLTFVSKTPLRTAVIQAVLPNFGEVHRLTLSPPATSLRSFLQAFPRAPVFVVLGRCFKLAWKLALLSLCRLSVSTAVAPLPLNRHASCPLSYRCFSHACPSATPFQRPSLISRFCCTSCVIPSVHRELCSRFTTLRHFRFL